MSLDKFRCPAVDSRSSIAVSGNANRAVTSFGTSEATAATVAEATDGSAGGIMMTRGPGLTAAIIGSLLVASCGGLRGGFSMDDQNYFAERPYVLSRGKAYSLCWRYGTMGFFFEPSNRVMDGKLVFALNATSSSGALAGRYGEVPISNPDAMDALLANGAYWLEPDGTEVKLSMQTAERCGEPRPVVVGAQGSGRLI